MNKLNFKTYEQFEKDIKKEMINNLTNDEKLDIYNKYCENNHDYNSMIYKNNDNFLEYVFGNNHMGLARAIAHGDYIYVDQYITLDEDGDLYSYEDLHDALKDKFVPSEMMNFDNVDFEKLYEEYIHDVIHNAKKSVQPKEFSEALKEYTSEEMIKKYPEVCDNIDRNYSDFILDEKDTDKSKDIDDGFER